MDDTTLIAEDLLLLLLDDDGASISGAGTLHYTLGGAVLVELALRGWVQIDTDDRRSANGPLVIPTGIPRPDDPLLAEAMTVVSAKQRRVQVLILALGSDLLPVLQQRLMDRGLITQEKRRVLGLFRTTRWPATDAAHEADLRRRIRAVLEDGAEPDPRTAAVIGLVYASGAMPALRPPLPWTSTTVARAQAIQEGDWGASAVNAAVTRTAAAIAVSSAAAAAAARR